MQFQVPCERADFHFLFASASSANHGNCGVGEDQPEENEEKTRMNDAGEIGAGDRARGGAELEEHRHAEIRQPVANVCCRRSTRGGDHRDDRRANRQADVDVQKQRERGNDDHAAAQSEERSEKSGAKRNCGDGEDEEQRCHFCQNSFA